MASQSVSQSIAVFIPALELLITEALGEWKIPGVAVAQVVPSAGAVAMICAAMTPPAPGRGSITTCWRSPRTLRCAGLPNVGA